MKNNNIKLKLAICILIGIIQFYLLLNLQKFPPFFTATDMHAWGLDSEILAKCLKNIVLTCDELSFFPLAYLMNSKILLYTGLKYNIDNRNFLGILNLLVVLTPLIFLYLLRELRYAIPSSLAYISALIISPLPPFYIYSGALEVQSGVFMGLFLGCSILYLRSEGVRVRTALIVLIFSGYFASLYKDTNILLMIAAAIFIYLYERYTNNGKCNNLNKYLIIIFFIFSAGILSNFIYNYIKFANIFPIGYIGMVKVGPDLIRSLKYFFGAFISPNGGLIIFWSMPLFINFIILRIFSISYSKQMLIISLIFLILTVGGFSLWAGGTFGWASWGARYMVPSMIAILILLTLTSKVSIVAGSSSWLPYLLSPFICISFLYTIVSYISQDKAKFFADAMDGGRECKAFIVKMNSPGYKGIPFKDWYNSKEFVGCENERLANNPLMLFIKN